MMRSVKKTYTCRKWGRETVTLLMRHASGDAPRKDGNNELDVTFQDNQRAFRARKTIHLLRAYIVMQLCSSNYLAENNLVLMRRFRSIVGTTIFEKVMKVTFFGHFVAGENEAEIMKPLMNLKKHHVCPILDYSAEEDLSDTEATKREVNGLDIKGPEVSAVDRSKYYLKQARTFFYLDEHHCELNMAIFLRSIETAARYNEAVKDNCGMVAIKLTALGKPHLLLQISDVITRARRYMNIMMIGTDGTEAVLSHHLKPEELEKKLRDSKIDGESIKKFLKNLESDKEGIIHIFPWSGLIDEHQKLSNTFKIPDLKAGKMVPFIHKLTETEEEMFKNMIRRMDEVVKCARDYKVKLMVDAEQTYFQPAISRLTLSFMRKYNQDHAVVYNTYQNYLKAAYVEAKTDMEQALRQNFIFGAKLVRGAYMTQERDRAKAMGYPDPVNPTYEATTETLHKTIDEAIHRIKKFRLKGKKKCIEVMIASHSEDTIRYTLQKMKEINLDPKEKSILFGQLYGMCDHLTFPLGDAGYQAYKYVPYGPVMEVLPYLSRRAAENKGMFKKARKEKGLMVKELWRRLKTGFR